MSIWLSISSSPSSCAVGNYINAGIWSALEPNMAVICACIPSLRPLASYFSKRIAQAPLFRNTLRSTSNGGSSSSSKRIFESSAKGRPNVGTFSQLDEADDILRPLGHDVSVRAGRVEENLQDADVEGMELPSQGIKVRTEVILSTSDRLHYNDRLF